MMTGNDIDESQGDPLMRRFCLRLDNGTRIGYSSGKEPADKVIKLEFAEGFKEGVVSEEDLYRISDIAGQLDARREAATRPKPVKEVRVNTSCASTRSKCHVYECNGPVQLAPSSVC